MNKMVNKNWLTNISLQIYIFINKFFVFVIERKDAQNFKKSLFVNITILTLPNAREKRCKYP